MNLLTERSKTLDILRALAVLLVLGRHMGLCPNTTSSAAYYATAIWSRGGWVGVDLFFVLSGFLVSGLLFREHQKYGKISFSNFILRRGLKIWPSFYIMVAFTILMNYLAHESSPPISIWSELFFLQNYTAHYLWGHTWSLAVEEHFYLILPLLLIFLVRFDSAQPFRKIPLLFGTVAFACLAMRVWTASLGPYDHAASLFPTHLRMDSLFFGVFISYLFHYHQEQFSYWQSRYRKPLLIGGVLLFIPAFLTLIEKSVFIYTFGFSLFYLAGGMLLVGSLGMKLPENKLVKTIAFLGSCSYSIYLWHLPATTLLVNVLEKPMSLKSNWFAYFAIYVLGSVIVGVIMARLIELPVLALRNRIFPSRVQTPGNDSTQEPTSEKPLVLEEPLVAEAPLAVAGRR